MNTDFVIGGIVISGVITALIQFLKAKGLNSQYAPYFNAVLTFVFYMAYLALQQFPEYVTAATVALQVLVVFLSAAGFYATGSWAVETRLGTHAKVK